jgi:hemoglobin
MSRVFAAGDLRRSAVKRVASAVAEGSAARPHAGPAPQDRVASVTRSMSLGDGYIAHMAEYPTLFEWAGGREAFDRMINAFYDRVELDDLLSPFFPGGVHEEHRRNVATWWCEVFGGPLDYTGDLGGYERMVHKHLHLGITKEQRFRFASLMSLAADDAGMPDDPEFRSALVAYLEWGTRLAFANSQDDAEIIEHAPVPRWAWGEALPYRP